MELLDVCFSEASSLNSIEKTSLYFISGYLVHQDNMKTEDKMLSLSKRAFASLICRGELLHPTHHPHCCVTHFAGLKLPVQSPNHSHFCSHSFLPCNLTW